MVFVQPERPERTAGQRPVVSDDAVSPDNPPDAKDAYSMLVEMATEYAVFTLSPGGVVSTWTLGAQRMKGYRADEIVGRHFSAFYLPEEAEAGIPGQELVDAAREGRVEVEGWRVRKDGSRFWARVLIVPLWDDAGRLRGYGKLTRDETERRAADVLGRQMARIDVEERIANALAGTVVHELFSVGLKLNSAMKMAHEPELLAKLREISDAIDEAIKHMRHAAFDISGERSRAPIERSEA